MTDQTLPEKCALNLGFVPLLDAAPLIVAQELGFFGQAGLEVSLRREASWASLRDKLVLGLLDGAHILAPMVVASQAAPVGSKPLPGLVTALALGYNGNAITFANDLAAELELALPAAPEPVGQALKKVIEQRQRDGLPRLVFGTVYPFAMHTYLLRLLLTQAGIDPEVDVDIRVIPPPKMVDALASGEVDGYCVGEPWNTEAARAGTGRIALLGYDLWPNAPEKVLGVSDTFAHQAPASHQALIGALIRACKWLDEPDRAASIAHWLAGPAYLDCSSDLLLDAIQAPWPDGAPRWHKHFFRHGATYPDRDQADWMLSQMIAASQIPDPGDRGRQAIDRAYDVGTWGIVAERMGIGTAK